MLNRIAVGPAIQPVTHPPERARLIGRRLAAMRGGPALVSTERYLFFMRRALARDPEQIVKCRLELLRQPRRLIIDIVERIRRDVEGHRGQIVADVEPCAQCPVEDPLKRTVGRGPAFTCHLRPHRGRPETIFLVGQSPRLEWLAFLLYCLGVESAILSPRTGRQEGEPALVERDRVAGPT